MRTKVYFYCSVCNKQNYFSSRNKTQKKEKIVLKKFCSNCQKNLLHKEKNK